jgi:protein TonB
VRFAPYIEELQEFFASACLRYGAPEDIIDLTERIDSSQPFAEDLSSMFRSIVLREAGELQHSQLLEIVALAVGGPKMDQAAQHFAQPLRSLLSFLSGVMRKPWNEPPDEKHHRVERGEVVPFPTKPRPHIGMGQSAAISAAADRAAHSGAGRPNIARIDEAHAEALKLHALRPDAVNVSPADSDLRSGPPSDPRSEREVPDLVGDPKPAPSSALDPETPSDLAIEDHQAIEGHQVIDDQDLPREESADPRAATANHPERAAAAAVSQPAEPAPVPVPAPAAVPAGTPSWQLAAQAVRVGAVVAASSAAVVPAPSPAIRARSPNETARGEAQTAAPGLPAAGLHPTGERNAAHAGSSTVDAVSLTKPISPAPGPARPSYSPHVPRTPAGMLVAGAALLVLAGVFAASLHRAPELVGKQQAVPVPSSSQTAAVPGAGQIVQPKRAPASTAAGSATVASVPAARVRRAPMSSDDEDADDRGVAAPYSTPIAGQPAIAKPSPYVAATGQPAPIVRPPSNEVASTGPVPMPPSGSSRNLPMQSYAGGGQAGYRPEIHSYRNPDAAIAGDLPRPGRGSRAVVEREDFVDVSSGMMAGNLISAPVPDYPALARIAHIGGPVVMQAVIAKNGSVLATHVLKGHRLLRGAAQDAVRRWRYKPYVMDGHPVEVSTIVTVRFKPNG